MLKQTFRKTALKILGVCVSVGVLVGVFYFLLLQVITLPRDPKKPETPGSLANLHVPDPAVSTEPSALAKYTKTVWVQVSAAIGPDGASAQIAVTDRDCQPLPSRQPLKVLRQAESSQLPGISAETGICVELNTLAGAEKVATLQGDWRTPSETEVPELDQDAKQWRFTTPDGSLRRITALAVDYCESEAGNCAGAVSLQNISITEAPFVTLALPDQGRTPLFLQNPS